VAVAVAEHKKAQEVVWQVPRQVFGLVTQDGNGDRQTLDP
jgi:hypothetical protein